MIKKKNPSYFDTCKSNDIVMLKDAELHDMTCIFFSSGVLQELVSY